MKILCRELMKIARQLRGSENIFGYKSTLANQLYLFYCFSGKIYFTDKIHKQVKYLWYGIDAFQILFLIVTCWGYLWNGRTEENALVAMLHVANAIGGILLTEIEIPLISLFFSDSIEMMIDRIDKILAIEKISESEQKEVVTDAKKKFLGFFGVYCLFFGIHLSISFFDVIFLFEEDKVKNYLYYALPVFLIQKFNGIGPFLILNGISTMVFWMMALKAWIALGVMSYWSTAWFYELIFLRDELNTAMRNLDAYFGEHITNLNAWNDTFERILKRSIRRYREVTLLIDDLKAFFEVFGTFFVYAVFFYNLFFLYNSFSNNTSTVLIVKNITASLACSVAVVLFYWIGQILDNSISEVSMAIYSTPWYRSVKVRKNVYIFLCQTQSSKNFTIFKVYRLLLNNFSRYVHGVVSYTNILLKLTKK